VFVFGFNCCQINSFIFTSFSICWHWVSGDHENIVKTHKNDESNFHLKEWLRPGPTKQSRAFPAERGHRAACLLQLGDCLCKVLWVAQAAERPVKAQV